jgi:hypothetical protein
MSFLAGKVAAIRLQKWLASEGAPHGAGVAVLCGYALFEDTRKQSQKAFHRDSMTRGSHRTTIV